MLPLMLLAGGGGLLLSPAPLVRHRVDARTRAPLMGEDSADPVSSTWWTTFDGRNEDGTSPDGVFAPGDEPVERDLKRIFNVDSSGNSTFAEDDVEELKLMFKLRQELGDEDFKQIFDNPRVRGLDVF